LKMMPSWIVEVRTWVLLTPKLGYPERWTLPFFPRTIANPF
jgi:hypothetical protein